MAITDSSSNIRSRHWLRTPISNEPQVLPPGPSSGSRTELFIFTGIAVFDGLKGTGSDWDGGDANISSNYSDVIGEDKAILPQHWTVDVQLASVFNQKVAKNTGWSVNGFSLNRVSNHLGGPQVVLGGGWLSITAGIAISDIDAVIHRLSYHVTILGKLIDWEDRPIS